ncbi:HAMP domain-containing protein [Geomonas sp. Red69]|uniref:HAMP domain-containing protein n=1 Tax=Geomonas diazotrophica TaxID=2843197 RepID=A0ABX8JLY0_9BACT|nr:MULTISPECIES: methyl-accepting chemotaxis protein [Geomonas]MBU5635311.1 HAMP domain-containing protein [Geomonas diazotrophica]QWV97629.1 HAMP domain-containing protein [Geomonas nitrogeniifigens]QXE86772.1 HAMP domain-containing protein [Geomonas nitrogeniifigens]
MTIKAKLILNATIVLIAVAAVSVASFLSMNSIKGKLSYLTEKSTPYQVRTMEFQRALQGATADLVKVGAARSQAEFAAAKGEALKSLAEVSGTQAKLEAVSGEKLEASAEFNSIAEELFATMTARLASEQESARAHAMIVEKSREASARLQDLEGKVRSLQQSSSSAYAKANDEADKTSKNIASIETLKVSLKELRYLLYDMQRAPEKKQIQNQYLATQKKIQQNGNIRNNRKIGGQFALFSSKTEQFMKIMAEGDPRRTEAQLKEALDALSEVEDEIEDEVDKSQLQVGRISGKLPGYLSRANAAVNVLSGNTELVSLGKSLEGLSGRLFFANTQKELDAVAAEFNQQYARLATVEKSVASLLQTAGAEREMRILNGVSASLAGVRETVFASDGIVAKLRQKMQLQEKAEQGGARLRDVVARQAEQGKKTVSAAQEGQEQAIGTVNRTIRFSMTLILVIAVTTALIGNLVGMWIFRSISRPIAQLVATAEQAAEGNLAVTLSATGSDEVGRVQGAMARMLSSLREVMVRIGAATSTLAASSDQMAATAEILEQGATRQEHRVHDSATAMAQMNATTANMAQSTAQTAGAADTMKEIAREGKRAMQLTAQELQRFAHTFSETAGMVEQLSGQSAQISEIGILIRDIADQTNLLALNAAIEAARAGEQGRGFAVVADSVRELAERTAVATADINQTVRVMQESVNRSVAKMGEERAAVGAILGSVQETEQAIDRIASYVDQVNEMVRRIAVATEEQSATSSEVAGNVDEIAGLTRELRTACSGIRESSDGLSSLAGDLKGMVGWFRV